MDDLFTAALEAMRGQIFASGFALMLVGAAMALARSVPSRLLSLLRRQVVVEVDVVGNDPLFGWLTLWLDRQPYSKRARLLTASGKQPDDFRPHEGTRGPAALLFTPAPGNHIFSYRSRPVWLQRERKAVEGDKGSWGGFQETITLRTLGRDAGLLRALLEDAHEHATAGGKAVGVYVSAWGEWHRILEMRPRALSSVFLPAGESETILTDARRFLSRRAWYEARGIPWRRAYLFEGPPGGGKTSFIGALAGELGLDLYMVSLADRTLSDQQLTRMLLSIPQRAALLIEEVDVVVPGRVSTSPKEGVTFAGVLQAMDGVASKPGMVTFLTTNRPEALDPALLRPGRVDVRHHFGPAVPEQAARLFMHFYDAGPELLPAAHEFGEQSAGRSMAEVQGVLLRHQEAPALALAELRALPL